MKNSIWAFVLGATALTPVAPAIATAQSRAKIDERRQFDIAPGELAAALRAWTKTTRRELIYRSADVEKRVTAGVKGEMVPIAALMSLLEDTGLQVVTSPDGAIAVRLATEADAGSNATPEILVHGKASWSLNTGIERTQDDSQPFIVMTREEIRRSGAPDLDTFLRNQLNVNTSPVVGQQVTAGSNTATKKVGLSAINLRGLGLGDTLILIDGRRQPGVNVGDGNIGQPSITGIPIAAIERIEVLASSASGIYGSGASGGVINIVMRRDFNGGELAMTYSDTTDFAQGEGRIDLTMGMPLEGGRTRVSLTGNYTKSDPLTYGSRYSLAERGLNTILANNPEYFEGPYQVPPTGSRVNFKSSDGMPLILKPEYGGGTLQSGIGSVPTGYRGVAADGITPLLNGIGSYDLTQPDSATGTGKRAPLLYGSEQYRGSLAVRREFNKVITGYAELGASRASSTNVYANTVSNVYLDGSAPTNPFTETIIVALPENGADVTLHSSTSTTRMLGGIIATLPGDWQAIAEMSYVTTAYRGDNRPAAVSGASEDALRNGGIDVLRDVAAYPLNLVYDSVPFSSFSQTGRSSTLTPSLRIAGKLPFSLPGGKPQLTLNAEITRERINSVFSATQTDTLVSASLTPEARQTTKSLYGEIAFPIFSEGNDIPLMKMLELRVSARHESYSGNGADVISCFGAPGPEAQDTLTNCPPAGTDIPRATTSNSHTDPSISMLWSPVVGATLRGSYTTGYLPPQLSQLVRTAAPELYLTAFDPERGNELVGDGGPISGFTGGNPDLRPESSKTLSAGIILAPKFAPGLRFSADWTKIRKKDVYFNPVYMFGFFGAQQGSFAEFLRTNPDRAVRGPASDGFAVGKIISLDLSLVNLKSLETEAVDFTLSYETMVFGGMLSLGGRATYVDSLVIQAFGDDPAVDYAGVVSYAFASAGAGQGALRWRGNVSAQWSRDRLSLGWQARYLDGYYLNAEKTVDLNQGAARVDSQTYHDFNVSYRFPFDATLRFGINNVFNKKPPFDASMEPLYYSSYGDPRLRNFYLGMTKSF